MDKAILGLAEAIDALRAELAKAMSAGRGQSLQFSLDPIQLTIEVVVTRGADGKIGWKVLEFGGSGSSERTQTLTLQLTPLWMNPDGELVRDFTISSAADAGDRVGPDPSSQSP